MQIVKIYGTIRKVCSIFIFLFFYAGLEVEALGDAAENYHQVLAENRRLFNEVQDLKGTRTLTRTSDTCGIREGGQILIVLAFALHR